MLVAASCARTGITDFGTGDDSAGGSARAGTSFGTGGDNGFGASSGSASGGRFGGMPGRGGVPGRGGAAGGDGGSAGTGGSTSGAICPSVVDGDLEKVVLAYVSNGQLWLARANGSSVRVNAAAPDGVRIWKDGEFLLVALEFQERVSLSLVDRNGNVVWGQSDPPAHIDAAGTWVSPTGDASVRVTTGEGSPGFSIFANNAYRLPDSPLGAPDALGWVPIGGADSYGFFNVLTGDIRRGAIDLPTPLRPAIAEHGVLAYLAGNATGGGIVVATPDAATYFPIPGLDVTNATLSATDAGYVIAERGLPRALLVSMELKLVPSLLRNPNFEAVLSTHGAFGLVVEGQVPRYAVALGSGVVTPFQPVPYPPRDAPTDVSMDFGYALGATQGVPLFLVDFFRASVTAANLAPLAPLRPMEPSSCPSSPALLEFGGVAVPLRTDDSAAVYVGYLTQFPWTRVGRPVSRIASLSIRRLPRALILVANSGGAAFCSDAIFPPSVPDDALLGDSVQVILPEAEAVFENTHEHEVVFHDTGACAVVRGVANDFPTSTETALPDGAAQVTFF